MKIGLFPDPYPEELLYSACARYDDQMGYPNKATALQELFGGRMATAKVDLPVKIDNLVAVLPPFHSYTADSFIDKYTLFPYYAQFLPVGRALSLRRDMCGNGGNRVYERVGLTAGRIKLPAKLRFCPLCVKEDRNEFRETYWHRVHQITGVDVCPEHVIFLEQSHAPWRDRRNPHKLFLAERSVYETAPRHLNLVDSRDSIRLKIARDAAWLLRQSSAYFELNTLRDRYFNLLLANGYA